MIDAAGRHEQMRFIGGFMFATFAFVMTALILGVLISQMFDGIPWPQSLIPQAGEILLCLGMALRAFRMINPQRR